MRTELPADRLHRRLQGRTELPDVTDDDDDDDDGAADADDAQSSALLSRWLPQAPATGGHWWSTVRADPGRAGGYALAAVAVLAVLISIFTLLNSDTPPVAAANLPPVEMVSSPPNPPGPEQSQAISVVVSVVGLVHKPGLVTLAPGARIADALAAAGGAHNGADLVGLNIAQRVTDGQQIVVGIAPLPGQTTALGSSVSPGAPESGAAPTAAQDGPPAVVLDLNTATAEQLEELPGIGPVTAAAIVTWRESNGPFTSVDQLAEVDGIGPARLDRLRDQVRV
ncbi:MAG: ComEA family DNA-binding protein [Mycobacterium sp.]